MRILVAGLIILTLAGLFLFLRKSDSLNKTLTQASPSEKPNVTPAPAVSPPPSPVQIDRDCIKKGPQIEVPSQYEVHVFRRPVCMPDISLEKIKLVGVTFWPKGEPEESVQVQSQVKQILEKVATFWEREFNNKALIRSEYLSIPIIGEKYVDEYTADVIYQEVEKTLKEKLQDKELLAKVVERGEQSRLTKEYLPNNQEFITVVILVMQKVPQTDQIRRYKYPPNGVMGIATIPVEIEYLKKWPEIQLENTIAHEVGHTFGMPDMYETPQADKPNEWFDPDIKNIMGGNSNSDTLDNMHLSEMVKKWMLNKKR